MPSSYLCHPLLLLPPIPPSIRVFSNKSTLCMRWPKYWSFNFSISPSNENSGLISFRIDCHPLLLHLTDLKFLTSFYVGLLLLFSQSHDQLFATPWAAACQASLSLTLSRSLPKFMSIESEMPSNHLILCRPLFLPPSIFPSIRVFSNKSALCIRWPKYWSFNFSISPSNEYSGLISFRVDWFDLLAVQRTLKSLLQHCNLKASILSWSDFFIIQF